MFYKQTSAPAAQSMLEHITKRAEERGMKVNDSKTAMMCVSGALSFEPTVQLRGRDSPIEGAISMKFLGITLDADCTFNTHLESWKSSRPRHSGIFLDPV